MTTLPELSRRVSEAEGPSRELDAEVFQAATGKLVMGDPDQWNIGPYAIWGDAHGPRPIPRYTTSLDAVCALIAEKLPNWALGRASYGPSQGATVSLLETFPEGHKSAGWHSGAFHKRVEAKAKTEPLARLAAALLAIHERDG